MRPEKVAHLVDRLDEQVLWLSPGIDRHFGLRRQRRDIHGDRVRVRGVSSGRTSIGVWQERTKSRDTLYTKSG